MYENGECIGGYHEVHKVQFLSGTKHAIATIESVIKNNLLYGCNNTVLESIFVSCTDNTMVVDIKNRFKDCSVEVDVGLF